MIYAGTLNHLHRSSGQWVFVDVGYSSSAKSCGFLVADGMPTALTFGELKERLIELSQSEGEPLNLVLEAPLSCSFNKAGNPTGRSVEKRGSATRYWYVGAGAAVLLGSLDLVGSLRSSRPVRNIRLFEGFASFKDKATSHTKDVEDLRDIFWNTESEIGRVFGSDQLCQKPTDSIQSVFLLLGVDYGVPPIAVVGA